MPVPSTSEQEFLARLEQGFDAGGPPAAGAGLFDRLDGEMRCLVRVQPLPASPRRPVLPAWWLPNRLWHLLWHAWRYLREVSGDDAYERYLQHLARFHPGDKPMTRAEHFKFTQEQKWDRVSRCC
jgi:uncharacterized short protein YbdD (DUF466 family)